MSIQDKLIDFAMKIICSNSYRIIEESSQVLKSNFFHACILDKNLKSLTAHSWNDLFS